MGRLFKTPLRRMWLPKRNPEGTGLWSTYAFPGRIQSAIFALVDRIDGKPGHNIHLLFNQFLAIRADEGWHDDDELAQNVQAMIALVQSVDPFADRFRYPTDKGGKPYLGVAVDLDELFQAHWIITTWCEGAVMEMRREC